MRMEKLGKGTCERNRTTWEEIADVERIVQRKSTDRTATAGLGAGYLLFKEGNPTKGDTRARLGVSLKATKFQAGTIVLFTKLAALVLKCRLRR